MKQPLIIYWSRRDFRLADNPALAAASAASLKQSIPFLPLFILEDYMTAGDPEFQFGYPSAWFLSEALPLFAAQFDQFALVSGKAASYIKKLAATYELQIFVNDDIYPDFYTQINKIKASGVSITVTEDALSVDKETRTQVGDLYSVFTPFKKNVWVDFVNVKTVAKFTNKEVNYFSDLNINIWPHQIPLDTNSIISRFSAKRLVKVHNHILDLDQLVPRPKLAPWYKTETEALAVLADYLKTGKHDQYKNNRDSLELDTEGEENDYARGGKTSKMSLALAWGLVSSRTLMQKIKSHYEEDFTNPFSNRVSEGALTYISELIWREFYHYQLFHHPELLDTEFQTKFRGTIKWVEDKIALERFTSWIKGETGYEVVDAAMKQIAETGWMHNRSRMIVASILTKNLGVDWRWGQEYFRAALIDLDEASNSGGWQWGASVGADPKPIRIFNPELQAKNYDASKKYRDKWLVTKDNILQSEVIPIIDHKDAREEALNRYGLNKVKPRDY